jgi:hypothetical protein
VLDDHPDIARAKPFFRSSVLVEDVLGCALAKPKIPTSAREHEEGHHGKDDLGPAPAGRAGAWRFSWRYDANPDGLP